LIDHSLWRSASWLVVAGLAVAGPYAVFAGDAVEGASLLGVALLGGLALHFQHALPSTIMLLLIGAAAVNAAGYVLGLWHDRTLFDEAVHAFTTFAGMLALLWVAAGRTHLLNGMSALGIVASALFAGLVLGLVWEGFEWIIGIIGNRRDTLIDLAMDSIGAVAAGILFGIYQARSLTGGSRTAPARP